MRNQFIPTGDGQQKPRRESPFVNDHYIPIPADLFSSVENGDITPTLFLCYAFILKQADWETGVWKGSALKLQAGLGGQVPLRTCQDNLAKMNERGYLKSFLKPQGQKGNYPVLVHRYPIRYGKLVGLRLNADKTVNPDAPVYERDRETPPPPPPSEGAPADPTESAPTGDQCNVSATSAQDQRNVSANTPPSVCGQIAPIPDIPDITREPEQPESQNNQPANQPEQPPERIGWLAGRIAQILSKKCGQVVVPLPGESREISRLAEIHGDLSVLLAAFQFIQRPKGLGGLYHPVAVFLREFDTSLFLARSLQTEHRSEFQKSGLLREIEDITDLYANATADALQLAELAYQQCDLDELRDYDFTVAHEYLDEHFTRLDEPDSKTPPVHLTGQTEQEKAHAAQ